MRLRVRNLGKDPQTLTDSAQKAIGADGVEYPTDTAATLDLTGRTSIWLTNMNPGHALNGGIVFDIPKGARIVRLELHDTAFSDGVIVAVG